VSTTCWSSTKYNPFVKAAAAEAGSKERADEDASTVFSQVTETVNPYTTASSSPRTQFYGFDLLITELPGSLGLVGTKAQSREKTPQCLPDLQMPPESGITTVAWQLPMPLSVSCRTWKQSLLFSATPSLWPVPLILLDSFWLKLSSMSRYSIALH
jgi:hypothetical protein